jgi:hypothetical protein
LGIEFKEPQLFDYLKENYYSDLEKSEEFDNWDCISLEAKMFIELKSRKTHYPDLLIEESKYQGLLLAAGIRSLTPWYINSTPAGVWGFNLTDIPQPKWEEKWLPITTEFENRTKRTKLVGFLKLEDGIVF